MKSANLRKKFNVISFLICVLFVSAIFCGAVTIFGEINIMQKVQNVEAASSALENEVDSQEVDFEASFSLSQTAVDMLYGQIVVLTYQANTSGVFTIVSNSEEIAKVTYSSIVVANNDYEMLIQAKNVGTTSISVAFVPSSENYEIPEEQSIAVTVTKATLSAPTNVVLTNNKHNNAKTLLTWDAVEMPGVYVTYLVKVGHRYTEEYEEGQYRDTVYSWVEATTSSTSFDFYEIIQPYLNCSDTANGEYCCIVYARSNNTNICANSSQSDFSNTFNVAFFGGSDYIINGVWVDEETKYLIEGEICELKAGYLPENYEFVSWYCESDGEFEFGNINSATTTFKMSETNFDTLYEISYSAKVKTYNIVVLVNNAEYGSVEYEEFKIDLNNTVSVNNNIVTIENKTSNTTITITANPTESTEDFIYEFESWTGLESVDKIEDDIVIMANFVKRQKRYNINFEVHENSIGFGTIDQQTIVANLGEKVVFNKNIITIGENVITATPTNTNNEFVYSFVAWEGQIAVVENDVTIKAIFKRENNRHEVKIIASPEGYGTVNVDSFYVVYDSVISVNGAILTVGDQEVVATEHSYTPEYTYKFDNFTGIPESGTVLEPIVITANFSRTANSYTLTLDPQGAELETRTKTITYGEVYGTLPQLTKVGHTFKGWFTNTTDGTKIEENSIVENASNHTIYAQWDRNTYTVTYNLNYENSTVIEKRFEFEEDIVPPTTTRRGYTFLGWFEDVECQTPFTTEKMPAENLIVYASWSQNSYTLTFDLNYSDATNIEQVYRYNDAIEMPENPTREGYTFLGWFESAEESNAFELTTMPDSDVTADAHWRLEKFNLTYNFNYQGAEDSVLSIDYGAEIHLITPTRTGFSFEGWFNESSCENEFLLTHMPANDVTIYAKWENIDYTLTYVLNYEDAENQQQTYNYADEIVLLEPTREGYLFIGWYNEAECLNQFEITSMPDNNLTVYAKWEIRAFLLTFNMNYADGINIVQNNDYLETIIKPEDPTREGYTFAGWYNESACVTEFTMTQMPASDTVVYAKWNINSYTLTYELNYDNLTTQETYNYNAIIELNQPIRTGYTFAGWHNEEELLTEFVLTNMPANDITIYAKWEINSYTITATNGENGTISPQGAMSTLYNQSLLFTFSPNQGYHVSSITIDGNPLGETELLDAIANGYLFENIADNHSIHVDFEIDKFTIVATSGENGTISPAGNVVRSYGDSQLFTFSANVGYHIKEIKVNNVALNSTALEDAILNGFAFNNITEHHTIHVDFEISSFKLIYDLMYDNKTEEQTYDYMQAISIITNPIREGYTFKGWFEDEELTRDVVFTNMPANDVTIYAKWEINYYTITYNFNYIGPESQLEIYMFSQDLALLNPTRPGYTFGGWYYDSSCTREFVNNTMPAENVVIYAKWLVNAYTLTFNLNYENAQNVEKDFDAGETVVVPVTIKREGYSLVGWYLDQSCTNPFDYIMPIYDLTIYAKWEINSYTITYNLNYVDATNFTQTYDYSANILLPTDPIREGYTFKGWFEDDNFNKAFSASKMPANSFEVFAKWEIKSFVLTFDYNYLNAESVDETFEYNSDIIKLANPTREGHIFVDWFNEPQCSTLFTTEKMPAHNLTVYAKWQINSYTITYNLNYDSLIYQEDTYNYLSNIIKPEDPTREGYTFAGWFNEASCSTEFVATNMPANNLTIYAKWNVNSYKITYNLNYANAPANQEQTVNYSQEISLIEVEREGYTFEGWYEDADCTNPFDLTTMPNRDIEIYAKWQINSYIIISSNGANGEIYPKGHISKEFGESQLFTFVPNIGYHVSRVVVDNIDLTENDLLMAIQNGYLFENINEEHTINVEFEINKYTILATFSGNGQISPAGESEHDYGSTAIIRIQPEQGNSISSVVVDGQTLTDLNIASLLETGFVFEDVTTNHTIHIDFSVNSYLIESTFEGKGSISPSGQIQVYYGSSLVLQIYPNVGQYVSSIFVDGVALNYESMTNAINNGYSFANIDKNHTIHVVFESHKFNIYLSVEGEGKFYSTKSLENIPYGESVDFVIEMDKFNYSVEVYVNGQRVNAVGKMFRIENVTEDLSIEVEFVKKAFFETVLGIITIIGSNIAIITIVLVALVTTRIKRKRRARIINK